jgi:UDP-N-acetylmuramoyl-tripeptide--D-alanyl-D-alanine ligase
MLFSVLRKEYKVIKTEGNFNNELGLPITMSRADENTDWMILEMGMRGSGEIRYLAEIAKPDYAIITSIEPVHAEILGSIENIAKTKAEICEGISEKGFVIINYKDKELLAPCLTKCRGKIYTVGYSSKADFFIKDIKNINEKTTQFSLVNSKRERILNVNASGRHNIQNAAAVAAFCDLAGINEEALLGLNEIEFSEMRFNQKEISDIKIINDAYNANPSSTCFSLETLSNIKGKRKIFIFADMFGLGDYEKSGHEQVADKLIETQVDLVFLLGEKVAYTYDKLGKINYNMSNVFFFKEKNELIEKIKKVINKGDVILLKGSRGMHLEEVEKGIEEFLNVL